MKMANPLVKAGQCFQHALKTTRMMKAKMMKMAELMMTNDQSP
jgi:hypothetical protein